MAINKIAKDIPSCNEVRQSCLDKRKAKIDKLFSQLLTRCVDRLNYKKTGCSVSSIIIDMDECHSFPEIRTKIKEVLNKKGYTVEFCERVPNTIRLSLIIHLD